MGHGIHTDKMETGSNYDDEQGGNFSQFVSAADGVPHVVGNLDTSCS
jgi:hypothetical protein